MRKSGLSSFESLGMIGTIIGALFATITYVYSTFVTFKDLDKIDARLIRIEQLLIEGRDRGTK